MGGAAALWPSTSQVCTVQIQHNFIRGWGVLGAYSGGILEPLPRSHESCRQGWAKAQWWPASPACTRALIKDICSADHGSVGWCWYHVVVMVAPKAVTQSMKPSSLSAGLLAEPPLLAAHATGTGAAEKGTTSGGK